jgi:glutathione S-transferase
MCATSANIPRRAAGLRGRLARLAVGRYPSTADVALMLQLTWFSLFPSQAQRERMLERIKTTFAPEISRYHIAVELEEQPL